VTGGVSARGPVHEWLRRAWRLDASGADLVRRALVLSADHELNASTYVARCVASTGASPYGAVIAAIEALSGPRHGGQATADEFLLRELMQASDIKSVLARHLQRGPLGFAGEAVPGFGHPLYPGGDPRAAHLLQTLSAPRLVRRAGAALKVIREAATIVERPPNFDLALAAVSAVLKLPPGSALAMFLIGRSVGWAAHCIEQYASGAIIRPRARYVGVLPVEGEKVSR
jgi:citrate synthase